MKVSAMKFKNEKVIEIIEKNQKILTEIHNKNSKYRVDKVPMVKVIENLIEELYLRRNGSY